jgi:hypothetical protein
MIWNFTNLFIAIGATVLGLSILYFFGLKGLLILFLVATLGVVYSVLDIINSAISKNPSVPKKKKKR